MTNFSPKKFKSLPPSIQHHQAAKLLRQIYDILPDPDEEISNHYHYHMEQAERPLREHNLLPPKTPIEDPLPYLPIAIYLDHIRSAHNVGSIFRTTEAMRLGHIHLSPQTPGPNHKQVKDASMHTWQWVPCSYTKLSTLPRPIIALETTKEAIPLHNFTFPKTFTLVLGNEEYGCSKETLDLADHILKIPLVGRKNSLNVANAFAIAAAEIRRQRIRRDYSGG